MSQNEERLEEEEQENRTIAILDPAPYDRLFIVSEDGTVTETSFPPKNETQAVTEINSYWWSY